MTLAKRIITILLAGQMLAAALSLGACCGMNMRPGDGTTSSQSVKTVVSSGHCHAAVGEEKVTASAVKKASAGQSIQAEISLTGGLHELCFCLAAGDAQEKVTLGATPSDRRNVQPAPIPAEHQALWLLDPSPPIPGRYSPSNLQHSPHSGFQLSLRV